MPSQQDSNSEIIPSNTRGSQVLFFRYSGFSLQQYKFAVKMDITVTITTFNEGNYLDSILTDLSKQNLNSLKVEIIILEAGHYDVSRAKKHLGVLSSKLIFLAEPGLSRTESLNKIFNLAQGELVVRLDARSHIDQNYLQKIYDLSLISQAENVGGIMMPIGLNNNHRLIAEIMKHPLALGGAKARSKTYQGYADSVYLGAFRKERCQFGVEWFDSKHPKISEDSDLNYRIRMNGGKVYVDSSIIVEHYPRENLSRFFKLCYNYGVGRGIFVLKHRIFTAYRQLVPPLCLLLTSILFTAGFYIPFSQIILLSLVICYLIIIGHAATQLNITPNQFLKAAIGFTGCHFFWTMGLLASLIVYKSDLAKSINSVKK